MFQDETERPESAVAADSETSPIFHVTAPFICSPISQSQSTPHLFESLSTALLTRHQSTSSQQVSVLRSETSQRRYSSIVSVSLRVVGSTHIPLSSNINFRTAILYHHLPSSSSIRCLALDHAAILSSKNATSSSNFSLLRNYAIISSNVYTTLGNTNLWFQTSNCSFAPSPCLSQHQPETMPRR